MHYELNVYLRQFVTWLLKRIKKDVLISIDVYNYDVGDLLDLDDVESYFASFCCACSS